MPSALQVPDPEGVTSHTNESGLYFENTLNGFLCRQVIESGWPLKSSL